MVEGNIIRSHERWTELGEKPTRYFYQLENQQQSRNAIDKLRRADDTIVSSGKEILAECRAFYKNLYSAEPVNHESQQWLLSQLETALSSEDQTRCEGKLTLDECYAALSQMAFRSPQGAAVCL